MAKKREQVMSIEEMRIKVKNEKIAYWHHSPVLFGIVKTSHGLQFIPVVPHFENTAYLLFFLHPSDLLAKSIIEFIDTLEGRYKNLPWKPVIIFSQHLSYEKNPVFFEPFKHLKIYQKIPVYLDYFNEFLEWAKVGQQSKLILFAHGVREEEIEFNKKVPEQLLNVERALQSHLRAHDPGLPLPLLYEYSMEGAYDVVKLAPQEVTKNGRWVGPTNFALETEDPSAQIIIPFDGRTLRVLASLHTQARDDSKVYITLDDRPLAQSLLGKHTSTDSQGTSLFEIDRTTGAFDVLSSEEPVQGIIKLEFKNAAVNPICFYGLRLG